MVQPLEHFEVIEAPRPKRPGLIRRGLGGLLWLTVLVAVGGFAAAWVWPDDLRGTSPLRLVQFLVLTWQLHLACGLLLSVLLALLLRRGKLALLSFLAAAGIVGLYARSMLTEAPPPASPTFRVVSANVYFENDTPEAAGQALAALDADLMLFQEWTPTHIASLQDALAERYPHRLSQPADNPEGFAVFSRYPFRLEQTGDRYRDNKVRRLRMKIDGQDVVVYVVHPASPSSISGVHANRNQSRTIAEAVAAETLPTIVAGDFNHPAATYNAAVFRDAGLTSVHDLAGAGPAWTWPYNRREAALVWPKFRIDDILLSDDFTATTSTTANTPGSDHRAVVADVAFTTTP